MQQSISAAVDRLVDSLQRSASQQNQKQNNMSGCFERTVKGMIWIDICHQLFLKTILLIITNLSLSLLLTKICIRSFFIIT